MGFVEFICAGYEIKSTGKMKGGTVTVLPYLPCTLSVDDVLPIQVYHI
jgi:hypothetical protein